MFIVGFLCYSYWYIEVLVLLLNKEILLGDGIIYVINIFIQIYQLVFRYGDLSNCKYYHLYRFFVSKC